MEGPDSMTTEVSGEDKEAERALNESRALLEKKTMVQMALAFAVSVKHYLRGEEGMYVAFLQIPLVLDMTPTDLSFYEDLYELVRFIPSLHLPSGIPSASDANIASGYPYSRHVFRQQTSDSISTNPSEEAKNGNNPTTPMHLRPSREPPIFRWSEVWPICYLVTKRQRLKVAGRKAQRQRMKENREGGGVGHNVPLEVSLFMSCWIADMQRRKTIDVSTVNNLLLTVSNLNDALSSLERILTTPIPWSYNAHIWEVTYIYCLLLPFQIYGSGFGWITIPATIVSLQR